MQVSRLPQFKLALAMVVAGAFVLATTPFSYAQEAKPDTQASPGTRAGGGSGFGVQGLSVGSRYFTAFDSTLAPDRFVLSDDSDFDVELSVFYRPWNFSWAGGDGAVMTSCGVVSQPGFEGTAGADFLSVSASPSPPIVSPIHLVSGGEWASSSLSRCALEPQFFWLPPDFDDDLGLALRTFARSQRLLLSFRNPRVSNAFGDDFSVDIQASFEDGGGLTQWSEISRDDWVGLGLPEVSDVRYWRPEHRQFKLDSVLWERELNSFVAVFEFTVPLVAISWTSVASPETYRSRWFYRRGYAAYRVDIFDDERVFSCQEKGFIESPLTLNFSNSRWSRCDLDTLELGDVELGFDDETMRELVERERGLFFPRDDAEFELTDLTRALFDISRDDMDFVSSGHGTFSYDDAGTDAGDFHGTSSFDDVDAADDISGESDIDDVQTSDIDTGSVSDVGVSDNSINDITYTADDIDYVWTYPPYWDSRTQCDYEGGVLDGIDAVELVACYQNQFDWLRFRFANQHQSLDNAFDSVDETMDSVLNDFDITFEQLDTISRRHAGELADNQQLIADAIDDIDIVADEVIAANADQADKVIDRVEATYDMTGDRIESAADDVIDELADLRADVGDDLEAAADRIRWRVGDDVEAVAGSLGADIRESVRMTSQDLGDFIAGDFRESLGDDVEAVAGDLSDGVNESLSMMTQDLGDYLTTQITSSHENLMDATKGVYGRLLDMPDSDDFASTPTWYESESPLTGGDIAAAVSASTPSWYEPPLEPLTLRDVSAALQPTPGWYVDPLTTRDVEIALDSTPSWAYDDSDLLAIVGEFRSDVSGDLQIVSGDVLSLGSDIALLSDDVDGIETLTSDDVEAVVRDVAASTPSWWQELPSGLNNVGVDVLNVISDLERHEDNQLMLHDELSADISAVQDVVASTPAWYEPYERWETEFGGYIETRSAADEAIFDGLEQTAQLLNEQHRTIQSLIEASTGLTTYDVRLLLDDVWVSTPVWYQPPVAMTQEAEPDEPESTPLDSVSLSDDDVDALDALDADRRESLMGEIDDVFMSTHLMTFDSSFAPLADGWWGDNGNPSIVSGVNRMFSAGSCADVMIAMPVAATSFLGTGASISLPFSAWCSGASSVGWLMVFLGWLHAFFVVASRGMF